MALLFAVAAAIAAAQDGLVRALRESTAAIKRAAGWALLAAGAWLLALGVFARYFGRLYPV